MAGGVVLGGHDCCKRGLKGGGGRDEANFFALLCRELVMASCPLRTLEPLWLEPAF